MIAKLKGADGYTVLINPNHVIFATPAMMKGTNGQGPLVPALGKCVIKTIGGDVVVEGGIEEVYGALRRPEALALIKTSEN